MDVVGATAASIFSSALARPIGFRVNSAPDASARYSRCRDAIIANACAIKGARMIETIQTTKNTMPACSMRQRHSMRSVDKSEKILGRGTIDLKYDNLLKVQDNVAQQIIQKLELNLSPSEAERIKPENQIS